MTNQNYELKSYIPIAQSISRTFGKSCEVVLHDLSSPQSSVIYTSNGHVTGRFIGQSFNHLITQVLLSKNLREDVVANYPTYTKDGRTIKSSTALIRNSKGEVIGALCINFDLQNLIDFKRFMDDFTYVEDSAIDNHSKGGEVEVVGNVWEVVNNLIDRTISTENIREMDKTEKVKIVEFMEEKGVFLVKGALEKVASVLKISKATIYSYLDEIRSQKVEEEQYDLEQFNERAN